MSKKVFYLIGSIIILLLGIKEVNASANIYVNSNGVEMNYDLYTKLSDLYSTNYMEYITEEKYNMLKETDFSEVGVNEYVDIPLIQSMSIRNETEYKILKIVKNQNYFTLILKWKKMPATRSYDVMGLDLKILH